MSGRSTPGYTAAFLLLLWWIFGTGFPVNAQEDNGLTVVIVHIGSISADTELENVLDHAARIQINRFGFESLSLQVEPLDAEHSENRFDEIFDQYLNTFRNTAADLLLAGEYSVSGDILSLRYSLFRIPSKDIIASISTSNPIDLFLDRSLSSTIQSLFSASAEELSNVAADKKRLQEMRQDMNDEAAGSEPVSETLSVKQPMYIQSHDPDLIDRKWETFLSTDFLILLGESSSQVPFGTQFLSGFLLQILRQAAFDYRIGITGGYLRLFPQDSYKGEYIRTLVPLLFEVHVAPHDPGTLAFSCLLGIGGAFRLPADDSISELLSPALPYIKSGLAINLVPIGRSAFLVFQTTCTALFNFYTDEDSDSLKVDSIVGISPGIHARWRF